MPYCGDFRIENWQLLRWKFAAFETIKFAQKSSVASAFVFALALGHRNAFEFRSAKQRNRVPNKSTNTGTAAGAGAGGRTLASTSGTSTYQSFSPSTGHRVGYIFLTTLSTAVDSSSSSSRGPRRGALLMPGLGPDGPLKVAAPGPTAWERGPTCRIFI